MLEILQDAHSLDLSRPAVDVRLLQLFGIRFEGIHIIREHDDLVASRFMIIDKELTRLVLVWVHAVQKHALSRLFTEVFAIELRCHRTPYLGTLDIGNVTVFGQIHPVCLVELWSNEIVEIVNLVVLSYQGG